MAVTQSTPLSLDTIADRSTDIVVDAGRVATVSIFSATVGLSPSAGFQIYKVTPSAANLIGEMGYGKNDWQLFGPGTYYVSRPVLSTAFGVCLDV